MLDAFTFIVCAVILIKMFFMCWVMHIEVCHRSMLRLLDEHCEANRRELDSWDESKGPREEVRRRVDAAWDAWDSFSATR